MLKNKKLKVEIIQLHHNVLVAGHKRRWETIKLVAWSDKRHRKIYRQMEYVLKDEKSEKDTSRKAEVE